MTAPEDFHSKCEALAKELLRVANTIDCIGDCGDELAIVLKAAAALSRVPKLIAALRYYANAPCDPGNEVAQMALEGVGDER